MATKKSPRKINFEQSLEQITQIVNQLEQGQPSLEESLQLFEDGIKRIRHCQQALDKAQQKVELLTQQGLHTLQQDDDNS